MLNSFATNGVSVWIILFVLLFEIFNFNFFFSLLRFDFFLYIIFTYILENFTLFFKIYYLTESREFKKKKNRELNKKEKFYLQIR